jgi:hypothetical protein
MRRSQKAAGRRPGPLFLALCCVLQAAAPQGTAPQPALQKVQASKTEHSDFPLIGMLHLKNSIGELTIEAWDQPGMEITTTKSSKVAVEGKERDKAVKLLDNVKITTERKGDEVTVTTEFPKHSKLVRPFEGMTDFDLEYLIKVPSNAHLIIDHEMGEVHIDSMLGEIHVTDHQGLISVRLPDGQYSIDALSKIGAVNSDFAGNEKSRKWLGQTFAASGGAALQKISLRIGYGDIIIARDHHPASPTPGVASGK